MKHQGEYIKAILKKRRITQEMLAKAINVSRAQVIKLLSKPVLKEDTIGTVGKILSYLKVDRNDLPSVDDNYSKVNEAGTTYRAVNRSGMEERIAYLERLLAKEERLNQVLERENTRLADENKNLQDQLKKESKKRDPRMEDGGSTIPARGK